MNKRTVPGLLGTALLLSQLAACSSPIIFHDTPLSDAVTAEESTPTVTDTAAPDTAPVTEPPVTEADTTAPVVTVDPETLAKNELSKLRRADLDGMNILIATADASAVFGDSLDGSNAGSTILAETRLARTRMVEERYNVRIINSVYDKESLFQEIKKANLSDVPYVADFYAIPYDQVGRFFANGLLLNLRTLPFTDFSADYYDSRAMNALSAGYGIWGAVGDYTFSPENAYAIYFNKTLNETLALPTPYSLVTDGDWTWETLFASSITARALLDADGNAPFWGNNLGVLGLEACEPLFIDAAALSFTVSGADRTPTFSADIDRMTEIAGLLKNGIKNASVSPTSAAYTDALPDAAALFANGDMLYFCGPLSQMPIWADIKTPWGIVPLPKTDASQKSYSTYVGETAVLCAASTNGSLEAAGTIMQALFAASSHTYPDLYLDEALKYYVRDSETVEMLDLICASLHYDFTSMFASGFPNLGYATEYAIHSSITQNYSIKTVSDNYRALAEKELKTAFPTDR